MSEEPFVPSNIRALSDREAEDLYLDFTLPEGSGRPYVATNTVVSLDGKTAFEGRSTPIGSRFDRGIMRRVRASADAVFLGAGSLRAEEIEFRLPPPLLAARVARGLPPRLLVAIFTARGDVPLGRRLFSQPSPEVAPVVVTTVRAQAAIQDQVGPAIPVLACGKDHVHLPAALTALHQGYGVRHAILEGGPSLNTAMLAAGLVDEVLMTLSPKVVAGPALTMFAGPAPLPAGVQRLHLISALGVGSELYLRYRVFNHASH